MKNQNIKRFGFTLIELLVVVLIIGILAAVALPQYKKAVLRSRYVQAQTLVSSIWRAEESYRMANGKYSIDFYELDIQAPIYQDKKTSASGKVYCISATQDVECCLGASSTVNADEETYLESSLPYIWCTDSQGIGYLITPNSDKKYCTARKNNANAASFCRTITGAEKTNWTEQYDRWNFSSL